MNNVFKLLAPLAVCAVVAAALAWFEAKPKPLPASAVEGTLGAASEDFCNLSTRGPFGEATVRDALTCRDLAAQESMARSTAEIAWITWLQAGVGLAGTVGLVWTLSLTLESMKLNRKAINQQFSLARHQLRPVLNFADLSIAYLSDGRARIRLRFVNSGESSARNVYNTWIYRIVPVDQKATVLDGDKLRFKRHRPDIPRGGYTGFNATFPKLTAEKIKSGSHGMQYAYIAVYDDDFGGKYCSQRCVENWFEDLSGQRAIHDFPFGEPMLKGRVV